MVTLAMLGAGVLGGLAGWLWCRPGVTAGHPTLRDTVVGALATSVVLLSAVGPKVSGLVADVVPPVALAVGVVAAGEGLRRQARRRAAAARTAAQLQIACDGLAASLAAGVPIETALQVAAGDWAPLDVVVRSVRLGGSVPTRMRELAAELPGAADLRLVAAAWQVAERGGAGLAAAVTSVAALLRRRQATRRLVRSELASARATARLLAGLPVLTLALGSGLGGDPIAFLVGTPVGLACLGGGLLFALAGLWWIETIAGAVEAEP